MVTSRALRVAAAAGVAVGLGGGAVGLFQASAGAAGNGAQSFTQHVHGTAFGFEVVTFLPTTTGPQVPDGCWFTGANDAFVSTVGNGVFHFNANRTGAWFTTTYTGTAVVLPIVYATTVPERIQTPTNPTTSHIVVTTTAAPVASGHLTVWFGFGDNLKNSVTHATLTFSGMMGTQPVTMQGHFDVTFNAKGMPVATPVNITCS